MKILFIAGGNTPFGISPIIKNQGKSLKKQGINIEYFAIEGRGINNYLKSIFILRNILKKTRYDIVHAHFSYSGIVASLAGAKNIVVSLMGSDTHTNSLGKLILKLFAFFSWSTIIVKSKSMLEECDGIKVHIIPNGVNFNEMRPIEKHRAKEKVEFDSNKKYIIFIADPNRKEKNLNLAKRAVNILNRRDVELKPIYNVLNENIPFYLNAADVLILTSLREGSPNVIKEAMACNCPIVSTDVGDVKDIITSTEGCYVTSFDPYDVANRLSSALKYGKKTKGRDNIKQLDNKIIANKIINIYKKILNLRSSYV